MPKTFRFFGNYSTFPEKWGSYEILSRSIVFSVMDVMDVNFWFEVHSSFCLCDLELMWILVYWETWEKNQRSGLSKSDPGDVAWKGLQKSQKFANFCEILGCLIFPVHLCSWEFVDAPWFTLRNTSYMYQLGWDQRVFLGEATWTKQLITSEKL